MRIDATRKRPLGVPQGHPRLVYLRRRAMGLLSICTPDNDAPQGPAWCAKSIRATFLASPLCSALRSRRPIRTTVNQPHGLGAMALVRFILTGASVPHPNRPHNRLRSLTRTRLAAGSYETILGGGSQHGARLKRYSSPQCVLWLCRKAMRVSSRRSSHSGFACRERHGVLGLTSFTWRGVVRLKQVCSGTTIYLPAPLLRALPSN